MENQIQNQALHSVVPQYNIIPTLFAVQKSEEHGFFAADDTADQASLQLITGSIVTDPSKQGASVMAAPVSQLMDGQLRGRILVKQSGNKERPLIGYMDFFPVINSPNKASGINTLGFNYSKNDGTLLSAAHFDVGPGAVGFSSTQPPQPTHATSELAISLSKILDIAVKVGPVLGNAGLEIYNQLKSSQHKYNSAITLRNKLKSQGEYEKYYNLANSTIDNFPDSHKAAQFMQAVHITEQLQFIEEVEAGSILSTIASIAKVVAPIALSLL